MNQRSNDPELDFIGGFALLAGGLWVVAAAAIIVMAMLGQGKV